jgi:hypothetical protein
MSRPRILDATATTVLVVAMYWVSQAAEFGHAYAAAFALGASMALLPIVGRVPRSSRARGASGGSDGSRAPRRWRRARQLDSRLLKVIALRSVSGALSAAALWLVLSTQTGPSLATPTSHLAMAGNVAAAALGAALLMRLPIFAARIPEHAEPAQGTSSGPRMTAASRLVQGSRAVPT